MAQVEGLSWKVGSSARRILDHNDELGIQEVFLVVTALKARIIESGPEMGPSRVTICGVAIEHFAS
jgi:hypothetical protein